MSTFAWASRKARPVKKVQFRAGFVGPSEHGPAVQCQRALGRRWTGVLDRQNPPKWAPQAAVKDGLASADDPGVVQFGVREVQRGERPQFTQR
jgi:hypothetical protein